MRQRGDGDWRVRKIKGGVESGAKGGGVVESEAGDADGE